MSMDNGHIIRKNSAGKFVLQEYSASADVFPDVESGKVVFDTLEEAVVTYSKGSDWNGSYHDEYGLSVKL